MTFMKRFASIVLLCVISSSNSADQDITVTLKRAPDETVRLLRHHIGEETHKIYTPYTITIINTGSLKKTVCYADVVKEKSLSRVRLQQMINIDRLIRSANNEMAAFMTATILFSVITAIQDTPILAGLWGGATALGAFGLLYSIHLKNELTTTVKNKQIPFQEDINRILPETIDIEAGETVTYLVLIETGYTLSVVNNSVFVPNDFFVG